MRRVTLFNIIILFAISCGDDGTVAPDRWYPEDGTYSVWVECVDRTVTNTWVPIQTRQYEMRGVYLGYGVSGGEAYSFGGAVGAYGPAGHRLTIKWSEILDIAQPCAEPDSPDTCSITITEEYDITFTTPKTFHGTLRQVGADGECNLLGFWYEYKVYGAYMSRDDGCSDLDKCTPLSVRSIGSMGICPW